MELTVGKLRLPPVQQLEVEIVERKGLGHPDTICDALAEEVSIALARCYLDRFGQILHHNVDKVLLLGGAATPRFGGGRIDAPFKVMLGGRATHSYKGLEIPVGELAVETSKAWLRAHLHAVDPDRDVEVQCLVRGGSEDLVELFNRQAREGAPLANDTSIGVGFAPFTELERAVRAVDSELNDVEMHRNQPAVGEDIKVMGIRRGNRLELTVGCAMIGRFLGDLTAYLNAKAMAERVATEAAKSVSSNNVTVAVNTADDPDNGSVYLTVSGTSAEAGDDGQAGRGNRANGLITPYRPMTLEAAAGKNPVTHVGKLYQIAAQEIAEAVVEELGDVTEVECYLVSQIGRRVTDPQIVDVRIQRAADTSLTRLAVEIEEVVRSRLDHLDSVWQDVIRGNVPVY